MTAIPSASRNGTDSSSIGTGSIGTGSIGEGGFAAVIFDMDGVIIDTHHSVTAFWEELAAEEGVRLSAEQYARDIYGCVAVHTLDVVFPNIVGARRQAVLDRLLVYEDQLTYTPVPGIAAFLAALHEHGVPTALATSGALAKVRAALGQLGLLGTFAVMVTAEDVTRGKPDPACYLLAAKRLGLPPARCIVFEDSLTGVTAATAAGAWCVGVATSLDPDRLRAVGARQVIPDFEAVSLERQSPGTVPLGNVFLSIRPA